MHIVQSDRTVAPRHRRDAVRKEAWCHRGFVERSSATATNEERGRTLAAHPPRARPPRRRRGWSAIEKVSHSGGVKASAARCEDLRAAAESPRPKRPSQLRVRKSQPPPGRVRPLHRHWHLRARARAQPPRARSRSQPRRRPRASIALHRGARRPPHVRRPGAPRAKRPLRRAHARTLREPYDGRRERNGFQHGDGARREIAFPGAAEGGRPWWSAPPYFQRATTTLSCEHGALMGLCECATQRPCRQHVQPRAVQRDERSSRGCASWTTIGASWSDALHVATLARWVAEGGPSDARDAAVASSVTSSDAPAGRTAPGAR